MSSKDTQSPDQQPPAPTASDVANAIAGIVKLLSTLPPPMQLRALGGAATALGVDKESRGSSRNSTSNSNARQPPNNQQRGGRS